MALGWVAYKIDPSTEPMKWLQLACVISAGYGTFEILRNLPNIAYNRLLRRRAKKASKNHGSADWMTYTEAKRLGLFKTDGLFQGADAKTGSPVFYDLKTHGITFGSTGSGKTIYHGIPNLLHNDISALVTDLKGTLACTTKNARETKHGHEIIIVNPANLFTDILGISACYNPLILVIEAWEKGQQDPEKLKDVIAFAQDIALRLCPPPKKAGENIYFYNGQMELITFDILYWCTLNTPEQAILSNVLALIQSDAKMEEALIIASCSDVLKGDLARMAEELLDVKQAKNNDHWRSFRKGAVQALNIFSASGHLAENTSKCDFRFHDLKKKKLTIYLVADPNRMKIFAPWLSLLSWCSVQEIVLYETEQPYTEATKPVLFLLDEASNFRIDGLISRLTEVREYGIRMWFFLQSLAAFKKAYSQDELDILLDQCEFQHYLGIASHKMADLVTKTIGNQTLITEQFQLGHTHSDLVTINTGEMAQSLITSDEILRSSNSLLCINGQAPMEIQPVSYAEVMPWKTWQGINPFFGKKFKAKTRIRLKY